jgi:hypothetical protein
MFLLLLTATFFVYWQKAPGRSVGAQPTSYSTTKSGPDELQRWGARILATPEDHELQRAKARYTTSGH